MSLTIEELIEIVGERYDPDLLIEVLQITSEEILERFKKAFLASFVNL